MVERYRRQKGKQQLLGSHQKCWIWGRNVVSETLRAGRWPILELHLSNALPGEQRSEVESLAATANVPLTVESSEALSQRCRSREHQGYVAKMPPYPYVDASDLLRRRPQTPLYVVLDRIQDPYNFGAIVRSAEVLGVDGMFVAEQNQCAVTSLVARTSAGAVNYLEIARVPDFVALARQLSHTGVRLIAASQHAECRLFDCNLKGPAALVIGNEGEGIADELLQCCDVRVSIPQSGHVDSLNAAVSAGILFYEASRQRSAAQCART